MVYRLVSCLTGMGRELEEGMEEEEEQGKERRGEKGRKLSSEYVFELYLKPSYHLPSLKFLFKYHLFHTTHTTHTCTQRDRETENSLNLQVLTACTPGISRLCSYPNGTHQPCSILSPNAHCSPSVCRPSRYDTQMC